ncbi:MAG: class I tRNA ligase family protein, partial [Verrucomicrobia bacterium]|nr:class I tRNA ligase family protein [Verrucomicrobiota bacterium]
SEQWFLKYPSQEASRAVVADGAMRFYPDRWAKTYDYWMGNLQDWCISRQLWWGHQIPVWSQTFTIGADGKGVSYYCAPGDAACRVTRNGEPADTATIDAQLQPGDVVEVSYATTDAAQIDSLQELGFRRDPDVLDTWFSSWLWPFATMGWPEKTPTLAKFYPTTDLVTGPDIIFFWVARMIMAGFEYTGEKPFRNVYFTGIIRDKQGRKMSKSLGNSPDPLDLIQKYGADALRFGVMRSAPLGQDILFDEKNVELGRNFCTKLWNAARFRQMQGGASEAEIVPALLASDDKWILLRLDAAIRDITLALEEYRFSDAAQSLYRFFWSEYCDWYLEASKATLNGPEPARKANVLAVMDFVFAQVLRLFHPFLPFITEELWHGLGLANDLPAMQGGETIMFAHWPKPFTEDERAYFGIDASDEAFVEAKHEVVIAGRGLRRDFNLASNLKVRFVFKPNAPLAPHETETLRLLLNAETLDLDPTFRPTKSTASALTGLGELYLPLEGLIDPAAEKARLEKEIAKAKNDIAAAEAKLANPSIVANAPANVVEDFRRRVTDGTARVTKLQAMLAALE